MKTRCRLLRLLPVLALVILLPACTTTKTDWNARVGVYTYDQAVVELGPPDKSAKLSDGSTVAEWMTRRGSPRSSGWVYGSGYYGAYSPYRPYRYAYGGPAFYSETGTPDSFLRLTFGADGRLQDWKKGSR